jgi:hypothetical protein
MAETIDEQRTLETLKAKLQLKVQREIELHKAGLAVRVQQQRVGADFAALAIRSLILVSGGAMISILTFIGNLWTHSEKVAGFVADQLAIALGAFAAALCLALITAALAYLSALAQAQRLGGPRVGRLASWDQGWLARHAYAVRLWAICCASTALLTFVIGAVMAVYGLQGRPPS